VITVLCVTLSIRAMRRGLQYAPVVASLPLLVAIVAFLNSPFASSLGR
jgi:hypothetical protein